MRVSVTEPGYETIKNAAPAIAVMLSGMESFREFCHRVMRDDGFGRYNGDRASTNELWLRSYRRLSWLVDLKPPVQQPDEVARIREHALLTEMATKFSEYKDLVLINLTDTKHSRQAISRMRSIKWTCGEDFIQTVESLCLEGGSMLNSDHDKAFALYTTADDVISSMLRSPQLEVLLKEDRTRLEDGSRLISTLFLYMYESSFGLGAVHVKRAGVTKFNSQENAHLALFYAQRAIVILDRVKFSDELLSRVAHSRAYWCLATCSRYLGNLVEANEAISHALDAFPDSADVQAEAKEIRMAMRSSGVRVSRRIFL